MNDEIRSIAIGKLNLGGGSLPESVPQTLFPDLVTAFVPRDTPPDSILELVITIKAEDIPTREFGGYVTLIDRLYGRLSPKGLRSYAHSESGHLLISEIHKSELEIIFRTLLHNGDTARFIAILLFLKSVPNMFKLVTEGLKNLAESYKSYEEGTVVREKTEEGAREAAIAFDREKRKFSRAIRREIRQAIKQESALEQLNDARKDQVIMLLEGLATQEELYLPSAIRFARRQVKGVALRIRSKQPSSEADIELRIKELEGQLYNLRPHLKGRLKAPE